ncbi:MAG: glycosyltransferase [Sphingobacteriales bacterium]|nr:MAG: glycosyltransferase [Sphingobacteriales bacterium]
MTTDLHVISFDVPYPPDYGGVMDVFHKIKALSALGVTIYLHCFVYHRKPAPVLSEICKEVYYYPRKPFALRLPVTLPYITSSRQNELLLERLTQNHAPILFEGLHSCYYLNHPDLKDRFKLVRMHNIEADYYKFLGLREKISFKKLFFLLESVRLRQYEKVLQHATSVAAISFADKEYLTTGLGNKVWHLPVFHGNMEFTSQTGNGNFALYHGNLSVNENSHTAMYLVCEVFNKLPYPLIIAGKNPPEFVQKAVARQSNCRLYPNPTDEQMNELMRQAHIHVLPALQPTGIKLKLLNALCQGRFCLVNTDMIAGTGLDSLCHVFKNTEELTRQIEILFGQSFSIDHIRQREELLSELYSDSKNAKTLLNKLENQ